MLGIDFNKVSGGIFGASDEALPTTNDGQDPEHKTVEAEDSGEVGAPKSENGDSTNASVSGEGTAKNTKKKKKKKSTMGTKPKKKQPSREDSDSTGKEETAEAVGAEQEGATTTKKKKSGAAETDVKIENLKHEDDPQEAEGKEVVYQQESSSNAVASFGAGLWKKLKDNVSTKQASTVDEESTCDDAETEGKPTLEAEADPSPTKETKKKKSKNKSIMSDGEEGEEIPKSPKTKKGVNKKKGALTTEGGDGNESGENKKKNPKKKKVKNKASKKKLATIEKGSIEADEEAVDGTEDVHKLLEEMEIADFNLSEDDLSIGQDDTMQPQQETKKAWEHIDGKERRKRVEVFSKRYKPSKAEGEELSTLATHLGVSPSNGVFGKGLWPTMSMGVSSEVSENLQNCFFGGHAIVLQLGEVKWEERECSLVLLTDGFLLMYRNFNAYNPLEKRYETCQAWSAVDFCEKTKEATFVIQLKSGSRYELEAAENTEDADSWLEALEHIIIEYFIHDSSSPVTEQIGWQYMLIRRPGFTAAVSGDIDVIGNLIEPNELDKYNQCSPLHYAVQQEECTIDLVKALLGAGADPNCQDADGRSAMYYAERNELKDVKALLEGNGGKASKLAEMEMRGELFSSAEQASRNTEKRRERDRIVKENEQAIKDQKAAEAAAKAESANSEMSKAMSALIERGEKIEQLDQKTRDLQDEAKTFGELAAQLKGEVKKKKWYQL